MYSGLVIKCTDASAKLFQLEASLNDPFPTCSGYIAGKQWSRVDATKNQGQIQMRWKGLTLAENLYKLTWHHVHWYCCENSKFCKFCMTQQ